MHKKNKFKLCLNFKMPIFSAVFNSNGSKFNLFCARSFNGLKIGIFPVKKFLTPTPTLSIPNICACLFRFSEIVIIFSLLDN